MFESQPRVWKLNSKKILRYIDAQGLEGFLNFSLVFLQKLVDNRRMGDSFQIIHRQPKSHESFETVVRLLSVRV